MSPSILARSLSALLGLALAASAPACLPAQLVAGNVDALFRAPAPVRAKVRRPLRSDARLAVLWVGHATALVQIDDKVILTDPVLTSTIGVFSKRIVEPGIDAADLPPVDAVLISHLHMDHLSLGSLEMIEDKVRAAVLPRGGLVYVPGFRFESVELGTWERWEEGGLRVTAVPVKHHGDRYGIDRGWMGESFTGYVVEHHGLRVYFGGDTSYDQDRFRQTGARFPGIDLALLPIGPVHPRDFMAQRHIDPDTALQVFLDLGARRMVPIHYDTFVSSLDRPGEAAAELRARARARGLGGDQVQILAHGEQRVIIPRGAAR